MPRPTTGFVNKVVRCMTELGPLETIRKIYWYDKIKFGNVVGVDRFGNKYLENNEENFQQHRWIEFNTDNGQFDSSVVPAEWHGWLHHMTDNHPAHPSDKRGKQMASNVHSDAVAKTHEGGHQKPHRTNPSQYRPTGYGLGSTFTPQAGVDLSWRQRGNPLRADFQPSVYPVDSYDPNNSGSARQKLDSAWEAGKGARDLRRK